MNDEDEKPERYLFGKIPVYKNPHADTPLWRLLLLAAPVALAGVAIREGWISSLW